jgi:calcineurin-like phosphoesterase family protein
MAVFVTSNLQLGRPAAMKTYKREFKSVDEMDTFLINQWNSVVTANDIVYHLGNFAWDPKTAQDSLLRLNGTIKLTLGEHDKAIETLADKDMLRPGVSISRCLEELPELNSVISYWPLATWPKKSKNYSIIGYPGNKFKSNPKSKIINVSTDLWKNVPQDLPRIIEIFQDI